jgi:excisionase family DNA binding protein
VTGYKEIWTETVRRTHVTIAEPGTIRFTSPDGTTVRVTSAILGLLLPGNDVHHLMVYGITEKGGHVRYDFLDGDDLPDEITSLIPELIKASEAAAGEILSTAEVARLFSVSPGTVTRWADAGKLHSFRTVGGHRRFYASEIEKHLHRHEA